QVPVMVSRPRRSEHLSALADDHAGVAVLHGVTAQGIPECLGIIVGVMVNKPRGDDPTIGIDDARGGFIKPADSDDLTMVHRHVGGKGGPSGAVNHASVLNEQVICHDASSLGPDASGPLCYLGASYLCPPCDAPAQVLLGTAILYAKRQGRSMADTPYRARAITTSRQPSAYGAARP